MWTISTKHAIEIGNGYTKFFGGTQIEVSKLELSEVKDIIKDRYKEFVCEHYDCTAFGEDIICIEYEFFSTYSRVWHNITIRPTKFLN